MRMILPVWNQQSTAKAFFLLCCFGTDGFVLQLTKECFFSDTQETKDMEFTYVFTFNKQIITVYNQTLGIFLEAEAWMGADPVDYLVDYLNKEKKLLKQLKTAVDTVCRSNMMKHLDRTAGRTAKPSVTIESLVPQVSTYSTRLVCHVHGFYPEQIIVKWYKNGEEYPQSTTTAVWPNGDWTYQVKSYMEFTPHMRDEYMCVVKHNSLDGSLIVKWDPGMDIFSRYYSIIATVIFVIGVLSCFAGLIFWRSGFSSYGYQQLPKN
ncbi:class II histocompatibility antigen, M beta 1 chain-like [Protopterus annectens]|uniref:class II histocompatibility antigen, M beta 1 chain-like n=1 Tax=Protopterus annectens TaxID=7888 RepID=UPI001CF9EA5B|nr:class II histocompatibility antigen, M beta 1 chain-like [Protopterus annectens]